MKRMAEKKEKKAKKKPFPIVAIGASAGGVEAVTELVRNLPASTGMAFVYIQHLDPTHKSLLVEILARVTKMKVQNAKQLTRVHPNNIYVIPPNKDLYILDGVLKLNNRRPKPALNMPVDKFFKSLAEVHREGSIGVVLSGNANDGTAGLKEIKNSGGLTFAQDSTAKFESMPKSAIAEGCVDMVLSPKEIAVELGRISKNTHILHQALLQSTGDGSPEIRDEELLPIIELLRKSVGVDFEHYKTSTIKRRIIRRMLLYKLPSLKDYLSYLKQHTNEITVLFEDLLINVTSFFRDPDTLEYVKKTIVPALLKGRTVDDPVRIWVPACSTGEEAYSLAIILTEIITDKGVHVPIQIFASDLSENAIAKARIGLYSKSDVAEVSPKRLQRFFTKIDGSYRINKLIRDTCVFAPHNLLSDPPFSRLDVISCCNLLIYLDPLLQKKVINTFHYSLKNEGYLILGKSEALGGGTSLFSVLERKFKAFLRKNDIPARMRFDMNYRLPELDKMGHKVSVLVSPNKAAKEVNYEKRVEQILLSRYVAASVVVNKELDILQFHGPISSFIEISAGKATLNLLKLVRPGLAFDLRSIIHKALKSNRSEKKSGLDLTANGGSVMSAEVIPLSTPDEEKIFLIVFEKSPSVTSAESKRSSFSKDHLVKKLQLELEATKEDIRSILEEQEASTEELQSANEEIVSSNEELQSINEELETSKEEVESSNEELMTINKELHVRNEQLAEAHEYSEAIVETIREAVLILDKDFRVRSANKAFYRIFKTREEDTEGMLLFELGNRQWDILELRHLLEDLLAKRSMIDGYEVSHDFPGIGKKTMQLHARTITENVVKKQLIILVLEDITEHRIAQRLAEERELWFRNMSDNAPCMIWMTGQDKKRNFFNKTWYEFTGVMNNPDLKNTNRWRDTIHPEDTANYASAFDKAFADKLPVTAEYRLKRADGEYRWTQDVAKPYYSDDHKFLGYIGTSTELHDKKLMMDELDRLVKARTQELKSLNQELQRSNSDLQEFAYVASHDLQEPLRKVLTYIDRIQQQPNEKLSVTVNGYLDKIADSSKRMRKLIDDLLDFSSISFSEKKYNKVDLNSIVKDLLTDLEIIITEKKAQIDLEKLPVIQAEPLQMRQLFQNLITNALKFAKDDVPPKIKITSRILPQADVSIYPQLERSAKCVEIKVSDNGIGFEPQHAEQMFEIFRRLNEKNKYAGTGIGLALCRKIVNNHHGHIFAEAKKSGATFHVILPL
jgi:two-component system, chemotaxis family, CheB/CheR fusion protein